MNIICCFSGILSLENSYLNNDMRTFVTSIIGITLYSIYTSIYFVYSQNKEEEIYKPLAVAVAVVAVLMVYTQFEDPQLLPWRFGLAVTVLTLAVLGFPLLQIVSSWSKYFNKTFVNNVFIENNHREKGCVINSDGRSGFTCTCLLSLVTLWFYHRFCIYDGNH